MIYGAIIGDIVGSRFENDKNVVSDKHFSFFDPRCKFTDDTVMTVAVAKAMTESLGKDIDTIKSNLINYMSLYGRRYPKAGYGGAFRDWLNSDNKKPYGSYGNGSAMRCSITGWLYDNLDDTLLYSKLSAAVTHNHVEGIKGAQAIAVAIYMARNDYEKEDIKDCIESTFKYNLNRTCYELKNEVVDKSLRISCQVTVPQAIICFLEGEDFEDVIRNAIYIGGDTDTIAAMAGSIAEAYYGVSDDMKKMCYKFLTYDLISNIKLIEKS